MLPRKYAIKRYFTFQHHLTSVSALPGETMKDKNSALSLECCTVSLTEFNHLLAKFIQSLYCYSQAKYLQRKRHVKRANFNRVFPKLHMENLSGLCTEPFNYLTIWQS